jgi:hypothetical protein
LWGVAEQTKRLKMLVSLGHSDIAAQGFSTGRKDVIRKALRYVEASGDAEAYTEELSRVFFMHLKDACRSFMDLFSHKAKASVGSAAASGAGGDEEGDMASLSYLIGWIQEQMAAFVTAVSRQVQHTSMPRHHAISQTLYSSIHDKICICAACRY